MFSDILIHPKTSRDLALFVKSPGHALFLAGPVGSQKTELARRIAVEILSLKQDQIENYPYFGIFEKPADKQDFPVEQVRQINKLLTLKTPGSQPIRRVIIVKDAHTMTTEAQNAFLKTLEEPPADTLFVLTAESRKGVLPTILSRTTPIDVTSVDLEAAKRFYKQYDPREVESAWRLSRGLPGLLYAALSGTDDSLREATVNAKDFLRLDRYGRLIELSKVSKDKEEFARLLTGLATVVRALYSHAAETGNTSQTKRLLKSMELVLDSKEALRKNSLPKLIAIRLGLNLNI